MDVKSESSDYNSDNFSNFNPSNKQNQYDLEININSILGILKGWEITFGIDGREKYEYSKKNKVKIFSVMGNKKKGKSFLLSKIVGRDLPNGFNVTTKGLSISFSTGMDNITLFDSVGFESPLSEIDGDEYRLKSDNENKDKQFYKKMNELDNQIKKLKKEKSKLENIREKENKYFRERNEFRKNISNKDEQLIDLTNERRVTDFFLQRFIIESAHIILLVVGKLSVEDQFFLNKLTTLINQEKGRFLQKVIVIHNLMTMEKKEVVEHYIEETLKKSLTFTLEEKKDLKIKMGRDKNFYNRTVYYEIDDNSSINKNSIIHLVMAKYGTEAGDYYNDSAIDYLKKVGHIYSYTENFDVIRNLKEYYCNFADIVLKLENPNDKIIPENIELIDDGRQSKLILKYNKKIELETFCGDLTSLTIGEPKFTPEYYIVSNDPEYVILYLDCPGETYIDRVYIEYPNQITTIYIEGNRKKSEKKVFGRKFGSGNFSLNIVLKGRNKDVTEEIIKEFLPNGFYKIKIKREGKKSKKLKFESIW